MVEKPRVNITGTRHHVTFASKPGRSTLFPLVKHSLKKKKERKNTSNSSDESDFVRSAPSSPSASIKKKNPEPSTDKEAPTFSTSTKKKEERKGKDEINEDSEATDDPDLNKRPSSSSSSLESEVTWLNGW